MILPKNQAIKPNKTLVLVRPLETPARTRGGIITVLPKRRNVGIVVAVGSGTKKEPMFLKEGMTVYNIQDCGERVVVDGVDHFLIEQRDILAIENMGNHILTN